MMQTRGTQRRSRWKWLESQCVRQDRAIGGFDKGIEEDIEEAGSKQRCCPGPCGRAVRFS